MSFRIPPRRILKTVCVLLMGLFPLISCSDGSKRESGARQSIFIMLDAARPDRFSCYGYARETTPRMDALAASGLIFQNHFAQATYTRASLPTLFYSRYFAKSMFPSSAAIPLTEPDDLFRIPDAQTISLVGELSADGIHSVVISAHPWIKKGTDFADDFDVLHDLSGEAPPGRIHPNAEMLVDDAIDWLGDNIDQDYFMYLHMMDTHTPHFFDADAQAYYGAEPYTGSRFEPMGNPKRIEQPLYRDDIRYLDALYDGSLLYNDRELGRLFDYLAEQGRLDDTLILITADHGEHLMEVTGRYGHEGDWYDAVARIPLIVHYPKKLAHASVNRPTEGVDVLPTMLALLDVPVPADKITDGIDLLPYVRGEAGAKPYVMARQSIRSAQHKAIFADPDAVLLAAEAPDVSDLTGQLFDLGEDKLETHNLWERDPETVRALLDAYREAMMPRYARYQSAVRFTQPKVPFALGTDFAKITAEARVVHRSPHDGDCEGDESGLSWLRSKHKSKHWLLGRPGAETCEIEVAVPNGEYRLSARIMGCGMMAVAGADTVFEVSGIDFDPKQYAGLRETHIGYIAVTNDVFRARLDVPADAEGFFLRILGFSPIGADEDIAADQAMDEERIERLRSLGYVD